LHIRCNYYIKVEQPLEGSIAFGVQTKLEALLLASNTLKIVENRLKMRKLWPLKVKGVKKNFKKLLRPVLKHLESSFYVVFFAIKV
jgi:hypothetical protein